MLYTIPYNIVNNQLSDANKINSNFTAISDIINAGLENDNFNPSSDIICASLTCGTVYHYGFNIDKKITVNLATGESFKIYSDTSVKIEIKENGDVYL